jgi:hypothetical protein
VLFAAITGVPTDLVDAASHVDLKDASARDAYYDGVLKDGRMLETPIDLDHDSVNDHLQPACRSQNGGDAAPARRIVEVAKGLGAQATVQSICAESFEPAMDAIIDLVGDKLQGVCLARPLSRNREGKVDCEVIWELPPPGVATSAPHDCSQLPYLATPAAENGRVSKDGRKLCVMHQVPAVNHVVAANQPGWYYDDFTPDTLHACTHFATPQRVSFAANVRPPAGVTVSLQCLDQAQRYVSNRGDVVPSVPHPEIGDPCETPRNGAATPDQNCWVHLADPHGGPSGDGIDRRMFCHPERNVCVQSCTSSHDCPAAWTCDNRQETLLSTASTMRDANDMSRPSGSAICVNPTCGGGSEAIGNAN